MPLECMVSSRKMVIRMINTKQQEAEIFKLTGESMIGVAAVILVTILL